MEAPKLTIRRARDLRRRLTLPEVILWAALRGRRLGGLRFRRQHPIGPYIVDFFCSGLGLAIEVDGRVQEHLDSLRHDRRRTEWLNGQGVEVFRISARAVLENLDGVLMAIRQRASRPLHHASHGPPPPVGEE